jgi:hypothetical protein
MRPLLASIAVLAFSVSAQAADKIKIEDVLAKHLVSIGTPEARAAAKTRLAEGKAEMQEVVRGSSALHGTASFACDDRRLKIAMAFPGSSEYRGEQWVFDGKDTAVAQTAPGARSIIGNFLFHHPVLLREGLFGGSALTSWSLLDLDGRQARLKFDGIKKVNGIEMYQVTYTPKKADSNMHIRVFFDPQSFRHVRTTYTIEMTAGLAELKDRQGNVTGADVTQHESEVRYLVEENFNDFKTVDGLTLPTSWSIRLETQPSDTGVLQWNVKLEHFKHNEQL